MDLRAIGRLIARQRRAKGLTLRELAGRAAVGRSTLAALEGGKLAELGLGRVARLCAVLDLALEVHAPELDVPLMPHRHLTEAAGRALTKAAIDDVITRGDIGAWRGLAGAIGAERSGRLARRVREVAHALAKQDPKAQAFASLLRAIRPKPGPARRSHG